MACRRLGVTASLGCRRQPRDWTFNAAINGAVYWTKYGAADTAQDRFPTRFGPGEVSYKNPDGRVDVTPLLSDPAYGRNPWRHACER